MYDCHAKANECLVYLVSSQASLDCHLQPFDVVSDYPGSD